MKLIPFNTIMENCTQQKEFIVGPKCNGFAVRNIGDTIATVNGIRLLPAPALGLSGESFSSGGNLGEEYKGRIQIAFTGAGVNPLVEVIQKYYVNE